MLRLQPADRVLRIVYLCIVSAGRFTVITQGEVTEFHGQIAEFRARYDSEGPGTVGDQFDIGEQKMKVGHYSEHIDTNIVYRLHWGRKVDIFEGPQSV